MNRILRWGYFLFHWILAPLFSGVLFFAESPHFFPKNIVQAKLLAISILSIFIPFVFYFLLKSLKLTTHHELKRYKERRIPVIFYAICLLTTLNFIIDKEQYFELRYFHWGFLISLSLVFLTTWLKKTPNLAVLGMSAFLGFSTGMSFYYQLELHPWLAGSFIALGLLFTQQKNRGISYKKLFSGFFIGFFPQIFTFGVLSIQ